MLHKRNYRSVIGILCRIVEKYKIQDTEISRIFINFLIYSFKFLRPD